MMNWTQQATMNKTEADDESDPDELYEDTQEVELSETVKPLIDKVRRIVKIFRRSAKKNEILQNYVKAEFKKELVLLLDTKTRWSSLIHMLRRYSKLREKSTGRCQPERFHRGR